MQECQSTNTCAPLDTRMMLMQLLSDDTKVALALSAELKRIKLSFMRLGCSATMKDMSHRPQGDGLQEKLREEKTSALAAVVRMRQENERRQNGLGQLMSEHSIESLTNASKELSGT